MTTSRPQQPTAETPALHRVINVRPQAGDVLTEFNVIPLNADDREVRTIIASNKTRWSFIASVSLTTLVSTAVREGSVYFNSLQDYNNSYNTYLNNFSGQHTNPPPSMSIYQRAGVSLTSAVTQGASTILLSYGLSRFAKATHWQEKAKGAAWAIVGVGAIIGSAFADAYLYDCAAQTENYQAFMDVNNDLLPVAKDQSSQNKAIALALRIADSMTTIGTTLVMGGFSFFAGRRFRDMRVEADVNYPRFGS